MPTRCRLSRVVFEVAPELAVDSAASDRPPRASRPGYQLAIDPFVADDDVLPLLAMASAVKVDASLDRATLADLVALARPTPARSSSATNVESHEAFDVCRALGADLYQGYFFSRPRAVEGRGIEVNTLNKLRLVAELQDPEADIETAWGDRLARRRAVLQPAAVRQPPRSSPSPRRIESIRDVLVLLGLNNVKRWATLMALADTTDKPHELIVTGLVRARMSELRGDRPR